MRVNNIKELYRYLINVKKETKINPPLEINLNEGQIEVETIPNDEEEE